MTVKYIYKLKRYGIKQFSIFEGYMQNRRVMIKKTIRNNGYNDHISLRTL